MFRLPIVFKELETTRKLQVTTLSLFYPTTVIWNILFQRKKKLFKACILKLYPYYSFSVIILKLWLLADQLLRKETFGPISQRSSNL